MTSIHICTPVHIDEFRNRYRERMKHPVQTHRQAPKKRLIAMPKPPDAAEPAAKKARPAENPEKLTGAAPDKTEAS